MQEPADERLGKQRAPRPVEDCSGRHSNLTGQPRQEDAGLAQHPSFRACLKVPMFDHTLPPAPPRLT